MPDCRKCGAVLMWNQPYKKGDLPTNTNGSKHMCGGAMMQALEVWKKKWEATKKYKVLIYCNECLKAYRNTEVCEHILADGFTEGVDTVEFYSDKCSAVKKREMLRTARKKEEKKNEFDPRQEQKTYKVPKL